MIYLFIYFFSHLKQYLHPNYKYIKNDLKLNIYITKKNKKSYNKHLINNFYFYFSK